MPTSAPRSSSRRAPARRHYAALASHHGAALSRLRLLCLTAPTCAVLLAMLANSAQGGVVIATAQLPASPGQDAPKPSGDATASTSMSVSKQTGTFTYSYPITVPPGRNGMAPSLALSYNHKGSVLGGIAAGWSLSTPSITRDPQDSVHLGDARGWVSGFAGGQRLEPSTEPVVQGNFYRAVHDSSYARYQRLDDGVWEVRTLDGSIHRFGEGFTDQWQDWQVPLTSSTDKNGNSIRYHYSLRANAEYFLERVTYTHHPSQGSTSQHDADSGQAPSTPYHAEVFLEWRNSSVGQRESYRSGFRTTSGARRLVKIETRAVRLGDGLRPTESDWVRRIELVYDEEVESTSNPFNPRRHLVAIRESGRPLEGLPTVRPETVFEYEPVQVGRTRVVDKSMTISKGLNPPMIFDSIHRNTGGEFSLRRPWTVFTSPWGLPEGETWSEYAWFDDVGRDPQLDESHFDINGDGLLDFVETSNCGLKWESSSGASGTSRLPLLPWANGEYARNGERCSLSSQAFAYEPLEGWGSCKVVGAGHDERRVLSHLNYRFMDMDGDGQRDLVAAVRRTIAFNPDYTDWAVPDYVTPPVVSDGGSAGFGVCPVYDHMVARSIDAPQGTGRFVFRWYKNRNGTFDSEGQIGFSPVPLTSVGADGFQASIRHSADMVEVNQTSESNSLVKRTLMDIDGDGYTDAVQTYIRGLDGVELDHWLVNRGLEGGEFGPTIEFFAPRGLPINEAARSVKQMSVKDSSRYEWVDINGDGLVDVVGPGDRYLNTGRGLVSALGGIPSYPGGYASIRWTCNSPPQYRDDATATVDLDGDGLLDRIVAPHRNWPSDCAVPGTDSTGSTEPLPDEPSTLPPSGSDEPGLPDSEQDVPDVPPTSVPSGAPPRVFINRGDGTFREIHGDPLGASAYGFLPGVSTTFDPGKPYPGWNNSRWRTRGGWIDFDNDGSTDFVDAGEILTTPYTDAPGDAMTSVTNPFGGKTTIRYARGTDELVVRGGDVAGWVVESLTTEKTSVAPAAQTRYEYEDPRWTIDSDGRKGYRGFAKVTTRGPNNWSDGISGLATVEIFDYEIRWDGFPVETHVFRRDGTAHTVTRTEYEAFDSLNGKTVHPTKVVSYQCKEGASVADCVNGSSGGPISNYSDVLSITKETSYQQQRIGLTPQVVAITPLTQVQRGRTPGFSSPFGVQGGPIRRTRTLQGLVPDESLYQLRTYDVWQYEQLAIGQEELTGHTKYHHDDRGNAVETWTRVDDETVAKTCRHFDERGLVTRMVRPRHYVMRDANGLPAASQPAVGACGVGTDLRPAVVTWFDAHGVYAKDVADEVGRVSSAVIDRGTGGTLESWSYVSGASLGGFGLDPSTQTVYDGLGRPTATYRTAEGLGLQQIGAIEYTDGTNPRVTTTSFIEYPGVADAATVSYTDFDAFGRVRSTTTQFKDEDGKDKQVVGTYKYDVMGNLLSQTVPSPADGSPVTYRWERDDLGRVTAFVPPMGAPTKMEYERLRTRRWQDLTNETIDGTAIKPVELVNDVFGRLLEVREDASTPRPEGVDDTASFSIEAPAVTRYFYDGNDNVRRIVDADGVETVMVHDLAGRRREIHRGGQVWRYEYDLHGNMVSESLPSSNDGADPRYINTWAYDAADRPTSAKVGKGAAADMEEISALADNLGITRYYYRDENGKANVHGAVERIQYPFGTVSYDYRIEGWVASETRHFSVKTQAGTIGLDELTQYYQYNAMGAVDETAHSDGLGLPGTFVSTFVEYDGRGMPKAVSAANDVGDPVELARFKRTLVGQVKERSVDYTLFGAATSSRQTHSYTYDDLGRITDHEVVVNPDGTTPRTAAHEILTYDTTGNVRSVEDPVLENTMFYRYDRQHQLVSAESSATVSVAKMHGLMGPQSLAGNAQAQMTTRAVVHDYDYSTQADTATRDPGAVHQLVGLDSGEVAASFAYDKEGNRTRRTVGESKYEYVYDADGKLLMAETAGQREVYLYDHNNQRVLAYREGGSNSDKVVRQWFGSDELWHSAAGTVTRSEVHVGAGATTVARIVDGNLANVEFTYSNGLGHLMAAVDMADDSVAEFHYGPFGELLASRGGKKDEFRRRFQGKEADELTGLSYFGYRYYDKLTLTWTQMDPLYRFNPDSAWEDPRRGVLYGFVMNNPLTYVDPDGRCPDVKAAATGRCLLVDDDGKNQTWIDTETDETVQVIDNGIHGTTVHRSAAIVINGGNAARNWHRVDAIFAGLTLVPAAVAQGVATGLFCSTVGAVWCTAALLTQASNHEEAGAAIVFGMVGGGKGPRAPGAPAAQADDVAAAMADDVASQTPRSLGAAAAGNGLNWSWKSRRTFGHTFTRHGAGTKNTRGLRGRAASTGEAQGQWLNNEAAADFLAGQRPYLQGPASVKLPSDVQAQVVMPNGSVVPATRATLVPNPAGGFRSAYPIP